LTFGTATVLAGKPTAGNTVDIYTNGLQRVSVTDTALSVVSGTLTLGASGTRLNATTTTLFPTADVVSFRNIALTGVPQIVLGPNTTSWPQLRVGTGSPEGVVSGCVTGSVFLRTDGAAGTTMYIKETGAATATGWVADATKYQPLDSDLTTIAGLTATTGNMILAAGSAWSSANPVTVKTALALQNVDNTSDLNKPLSNAAVSALSTKADKATTVTLNAPLTGSSTLAGPLTFGVNTVSSTGSGVVPAAGTGSANYLRNDVTWVNPHVQLGIDTQFRTGSFVSGGINVNPTRQISFNYGGVANNYRHDILTSHNGGAITQNSMVFNLWQPADTVGGAPSNTVLTLDGALITAAKPISLPGGIPADPLYAASRGYVDTIMNNHLVATDPHPQYLTQSEGDGLYVNVAGDNIPAGINWTAPVGTAPFTVVSDTVVTNLNADKIDGKTASEFIWTSGGGTISSGNLAISTGNISFGSRVGEHILLSPTHAMGLQGPGDNTQDTISFRAAQAFYWYKGGTPFNQTRGQPGIGGTTLLELTEAPIPAFKYKGNKIWTAADNGHTIDSSGINADMLDTRHATYFASQAELESLLGDLLYVGVYDASGYMLPNRYIPFNAAVPNTLTGWTFDPPLDASIDFRCDCTIPTVAVGANHRVITGNLIFNFSNTALTSSFLASDATTVGITTTYPASSTGWVPGARIQLRASWNGTTDTFSHYWRLANAADLLYDPPAPVGGAPPDLATWNQLGVSTLFGSKQVSDPASAMVIGGAASTYYTGKVYRVVASANGNLSFDLRGSDPTITIGTYAVTNKALTSNVATLTLGAHTLTVGTLLEVSGVDSIFDGLYTVTAKTATTISYNKTNVNVTSAAVTGGTVRPPVPISAAVSPFAATLGGATMTMVGAGMLRLDLRPDPDWDVGPTVYRSGMYWVCNSSGALDFIDADASGRYHFGEDDQVSVSNGDWIIAHIPGYAITNKALVANVATLTVSLPVAVAPAPPITKHTLLVGDTIEVALTTPDPVFDGTYTITAVTDTTLSYLKTNVAVPSVGTTGLVSGSTLSQVNFQYIPFSSETYVKNQILDHIAAPDPHPQYMRQSETDDRYAKIEHTHTAQIRQQIIDHTASGPWDVTAWEWETGTGIVTLTVPKSSDDLYHNILPLGDFNLEGVHADLNTKWHVYDAETAPDKIRFIYAKPDAIPPIAAGTPPTGYTVPVSLALVPGRIINDPHARYLEKIEGDVFYAPKDHNHDGRYEPAGAVLAHELKADPHPQYLNQPEADLLYLTPIAGDARYSRLGHTHPENLETHATDGAVSSDIWMGAIEPTAGMGLAVGDLWILTDSITLTNPSTKILSVAYGAGISSSVAWPAWDTRELIDTILLESSTNGTTFATLSTTPTPNPYLHLGLTSNTVYYYRIKGHNSIGFGSLSPVASIAMLPVAPTVTAASSGPTVASVTWTQSGGNPSSYTYEVFVNGVSKGTQSSGYSIVTTENTLVTFGVRATSTVAGSGLTTGIVNSTITTANTAPPAPTGTPVVSGLTHAQATVTWNAVTVADLKDYLVYLDGVLQAATTATSYTYTGLTANRLYTFGIKSRDNASTPLLSTGTAQVTATTLVSPDSTPPTAPTINSFQPVGAYGVMVVNFNLNTGTTQYRVDRSTDNANWTIDINWTATGTGNKVQTLNSGAAMATTAGGKTIYCRVYVRDDALNLTYSDAPAYTLIATPTTITATGTNHWRPTNGGCYNAMGASRVVQGYYSNSTYNAVGLWFYGTKPNTSLSYNGRRTITGGTIYMKREDGGASVGYDPVIYLHDQTDNPGPGLVTNRDPTLNTTGIFGGVSVDVNLAWEATSGTLVPLPSTYASQLVAGTHRGVAIYIPTSSHISTGHPYMTLSNLSEDAASGQLSISHYG
jgi:hypothetical protein